ncbi:methyltransferase, FxLD system, partial [Micromonospora aurantiaca]|nr:methyltransferase, FxLD system [Micromonospora aurantiaca]
MDTASRTDPGEEPRNALVDTIIANHAGKGFTMPAEVERAMRTVAR